MRGRALEKEQKVTQRGIGGIAKNIGRNLSPGNL